MGSIGDPRKLKTIKGLPNEILVDAGKFLDDKKWFKDFKSRPYGKKQLALSEFLWDKHKHSFTIEKLVFSALEVIASEGVDAWNTGSLPPQGVPMIAAASLRWPKNLPKTKHQLKSLFPNMNDDEIDELLFL